MSGWEPYWLGVDKEGVRGNFESAWPLSFPPQTREARSLGLYQMHWLKFWPWVKRQQWSQPTSSQDLFLGPVKHYKVQAILGISGQWTHLVVPIPALPKGSSGSDSDPFTWRHSWGPCGEKVSYKHRLSWSPPKQCDGKGADPGCWANSAFLVTSASPSPSESPHFLNEGGQGKEWNTGDEQTSVWELALPPTSSVMLNKLL